MRTTLYSWLGALSVGISVGPRTALGCDEVGGFILSLSITFPRSA